jgi:uncharacterized protein GlcG (DUF336 family)
MYMRKQMTGVVTCALAFGLCTIPSLADDNTDPGDNCAGLPGYSQLKAALAQATDAEASGLNMNMWATVVNRDGVVCVVAFTGVNRGAQWPASRVISAQKANTANSLSLDASARSGANGGALALSTANLYSAVQPGGSLFGLQESNPVDTTVAYRGPASNYGTASDPMIGSRIGGNNVFGGGLALYTVGSHIVGGVGVSGDTSCSDHNIAWRVRHNLNLDYLKGAIAGPAGIFAGDSNHPDNIIFDIALNPDGGTGKSTTGFGHPTCLNNPLAEPAAPGKPPVASDLPAVQ